MHGFVGSTASTGAGAGQDIDRGVSRRSVLRTGALVTAWSVPLVQVVAAAPAVAASGGLPAALAIPLATGLWAAQGNSPQLDITTDIQNTGPGATVSLQVTFTFPAGWSGTLPTAPSGWSTSSTSSPYVFTPATQLAAGQTSRLAPAFQSTKGKGQALNIDVSVTAAGVPSVGTQIAVAARP